LKTEATVEERLTEEQCWELFQRLFPNGLDDPSLVQKLAPEGWERSPLVVVYHPTAEQVYEETLRFRDNLRRLRGKTAPPEEEAQITLDALRQEMPVDAPKPAEECADLLGCCLWDVFADNHDVCTAKGALVDLGSFRAAAGFIADFRHRRSHSEAWLNERRDYIEFYLGTWMVRLRADLTPVYELIFRRMQQLGLDWRYVHPRLMLVDLHPLHEALESENILARIIHERFYCNRGFAAATHLAACFTAPKRAGSPLGRLTSCSRMPPFLPAPRARLAGRLHDFVTNRHE
jgi:hypothetical protein